MGTFFKPATRHRLKLRMALDGPSGAGKTYTALRFAFAIGQLVAVIDTESGSASKYQGESPDGVPWEFDVLELRDFSPAKYAEAIVAAAREGYDVLVIDSLSHAWQGPGGALELVDRKAATMRTSNTFTAWKDVTPLHNQMVDSILRAPLHVIATMRSKMEYVLEQDERTGKTVPRKVGMAPIQRQGVEYEFDVVCDLDQSHILTVSKSRCSALADQVTTKPGPTFVAPLKDWLEKGTRPEPVKAQEPAGEVGATAAQNGHATTNGHTTPQAAKPRSSRQQAQAVATQPPQPQPQQLGEQLFAEAATAEPGIHAEIASLFERLEIPLDKQEEVLRKRGVASIRSLSAEQASGLLGRLRELELKKRFDDVPF